VHCRAGSSGGDFCWRLGDECRRRENWGAEGVGCREGYPLPTGAMPHPQKNFQFLNSKRRVLVHSGCYFCSWNEWKLVRPLSGMHWLVCASKIIKDFSVLFSGGGMKHVVSLSEYGGTCPPQSPPRLEVGQSATLALPWPARNHASTSFLRNTTLLCGRANTGHNGYLIIWNLLQWHYRIWTGVINQRRSVSEERWMFSAACVCLSTR